MQLVPMAGKCLEPGNTQQTARHERQTADGKPIGHVQGPFRACSWLCRVKRGKVTFGSTDEHRVTAHDGPQLLVVLNLEVTHAISRNRTMVVAPLAWVMGCRQNCSMRLSANYFGRLRQLSRWFREPLSLLLAHLSPPVLRGNLGYMLRWGLVDVRGSIPTSLYSIEQSSR